jgi:hypothetical protein
MALDPKVVIERVRQWQTNPRAHPLTCGNDSAHQKLEPVEANGTVVLRCLDCGYEQLMIPAVVLLDPERLL